MVSTISLESNADKPIPGYEPFWSAADVEYYLKQLLLTGNAGHSAAKAARKRLLRGTPRMAIVGVNAPDAAKREKLVQLLDKVHGARSFYREDLTNACLIFGVAPPPPPAPARSSSSGSLGSWSW